MGREGVVKQSVGRESVEGSSGGDPSRIPPRWFDVLRKRGADRRPLVTIRLAAYLPRGPLERPPPDGLLFVDG